MPRIVLHAAWRLSPAGDPGASGALLLWAERVGPPAPRRPGRPPRLAPHPFACSADDVARAVATAIDPVAAPVAAKPIEATFVLPAFHASPLPSPALVRCAALAPSSDDGAARATPHDDGAAPADPGATAALRAFRVPAIELDALAALDVLSALPPATAATDVGPPPAVVLGDDVRVWSAAALATLGWLAEGRAVPGLAGPDDGGGAHAVWQPLLDRAADRQRLARLADALPAAGVLGGRGDRDGSGDGQGLSAARAHPVGGRGGSAAQTHPAGPADRADAVHAFVAAATDAAFRTWGAAVPPVPAGDDVASAWLTALRTPDARVRGPAFAIRTFANAHAAWTAQLHVGGNAAWRIGLRLDAPDPVLDPLRVDGGLAAHGDDAGAGRGMQAGTTAERRLAPAERDGGGPAIAASALPWHLAYELQAADDPSLILPADAVWSHGPAARRRGAGAAALATIGDRAKPDEAVLLRGLGYAARLFPPLAGSLSAARPVGADLAPADALQFMRDAAPLLAESGFSIRVPPWWTDPRHRLSARLRVSPRGAPPAEQTGLLGFDQLAEYRWQMAVGDAVLTEDEFLALAELKAPLVQLRGRWVVLDPDALDAAMRFWEARPSGGGAAEALRLALAGGDAGGAAGGVPVTDIACDGWLADLVSALADDRPTAPHVLPGGLNAELRPYQLRGFEWLAELRRWGLGALLADDMGLGKTLQAIVLILSAHAATGGGPALVICPTSVAGNWRREVQRFAPELAVAVHHGPARPQGDDFARWVAHGAEAGDCAGGGAPGGRAGGSDMGRIDVVVTSFATARLDAAALAAIDWEVLVVDEAQNLKNPSAAQTQAVRGVPARTRIALTGTPVENRLTDLWSIMELLNPGWLGSLAAFRRRFALPIERYGNAEAAAELRKLVGPFMLRRLKTDPAVAADLPAKIEAKVYCPLTAEQATLYQAVVDDALADIDAAGDGDEMARRGKILAVLLRLKQVCDHPALFLADGSVLGERSGKLARLGEMLEEVLASGERALVFTQFATMGKLLCRHLEDTLGRPALLLHGGVTRLAREKLIARFQDPGGDAPVFVLSVKAGGVGLNLTAANHVFHYDRWWNPAVENQATDRAFRIGQTRQVQVHKFVCQGTLEDNIDALIERKAALAERIVGGGEGWLTELSTSALRELLALRPEAVAG